ncbi:MAG: Holliday junction resolvase RuvX [Candidatus Saccharimonas sp.]
MTKGAIGALDVGEKRIGVAIADPSIKIAIAYDTFLVDGSELEQITRFITLEEVETLVVGYPRNQQGEATAQTRFVEDFVEQLGSLDVEIVFQDESLTSVKAEEYLRRQKKPFAKGEVDALAASFILQDYLEQH